MCIAVCVRPRPTLNCSGHAVCLRRHVSFQYLCECVLCELLRRGGSAFRYKWHPSRLEHCSSDESVSVQILPTANPLHHGLMEHITLIPHSPSLSLYVPFFFPECMRVCVYKRT